MRAMQISRFGNPDVFEMAEIPQPDAGDGQVLIRVRAAGINFAETLMREDKYAVSPPLPAILGSEVVGTVEALGPGVNAFSVGQRVAAPLFAAGIFFGGYAEFVAISSEYVVPLPEGLAFEDATALMVQGLTALYLTKQAPPEGKSVLVNAAAGGVGSMLVQLSRQAGARSVIATASSAEKREFALSLGADDAIDYTRAGWTDELREVTGGSGPDIIYESVGGAITRSCIETLAPEGEIVIYGALNIRHFQFGPEDLGRLIFNNQSLTGMALVPLLDPHRLRTDLAELFDLAVSGKLKVTLGGVFSLEQLAEAHRAMEQRATIGKLVLVP